MLDTIIINRMGIGDIVLTTPLATILKQAYGCRIGFVVADKAADLLLNHPYIDDVYSYSKRSKKTVAAQIKAAGYQQAIIADQRLSSTLLALKAGCKPYNWGFGISLGALRLFHKPDKADTAIIHYVKYLDYQEDILPEWLLPIVGGVDPEQEEKINQLALKIKNETNKMILIAPQGLNPNKSWPLTHCSILNRLLNQQGIKPVYVGSSADQGQYAAMEGQFFNIAGQLSLRELARLAVHADLCISVCTGPMHVMASSGVPVIGLYGPTSPQFWAPAQADIIQAKVDCMPCSSLECINDVRYQCMLAITPECVLDAVTLKVSEKRVGL
jgi:heptosyltransferase-2